MLFAQPDGRFSAEQLPLKLPTTSRPGCSCLISVSFFHATVSPADDSSRVNSCSRECLVRLSRSEAPGEYTASVCVCACAHTEKHNTVKTISFAADIDITPR